MINPRNDISKIEKIVLVLGALAMPYLTAGCSSDFAEKVKSHIVVNVCDTEVSKDDENRLVLTDKKQYSETEQGSVNRKPDVYTVTGGFRISF